MVYRHFAIPHRVASYVGHESLRRFSLMCWKWKIEYNQTYFNTVCYVCVYCALKLTPEGATTFYICMYICVHTYTYTYVIPPYPTFLFPKSVGNNLFVRIESTINQVFSTLFYVLGCLFGYKLLPIFPSHTPYIPINYVLFERFYFVESRGIINLDKQFIVYICMYTVHVEFTVITANVRYLMLGNVWFINFACITIVRTYICNVFGFIASSSL